MTSQVVLDQIRELEQFIDVWETPETAPFNATEIHKPDDGTQDIVPSGTNEKPNEIIYAKTEPLLQVCKGQSVPEDTAEQIDDRNDLSEVLSDNKSKQEISPGKVSVQDLSEGYEMKERCVTEKTLEEIKPEEKVETEDQEKPEEKVQDVEEKIEDVVAEEKTEQSSLDAIKGKPEENLENRLDEKAEEIKAVHEKPEEKETDFLGEKPEENIGEEKPEERPEENLGEKPEERMAENEEEKKADKAEESKQGTNTKRIQRKAIPDNYKIRSKDDRGPVEPSCSLFSLASAQNPANDSPRFLESSVTAIHTISKEKVDPENITEVTEKSFLYEQPPTQPVVQSRTTSISSKKSSRSAKSTRRQAEKSKPEASQKYIERSYEEMMRIPDIFERIAFYDKTLELCLKSESPISEWSQFMSTRGKPAGLEEGYVPLPRSESDLDSSSQGSVSTTFGESISFFLKKAAGSQAFVKRPIENKSLLMQSQNKNNYGSGVFGRSISRLNLSRSTQISKYDQPKILGHRVNALSKRSPCSIRNTTRVTNLGPVKSSISTPQASRKEETSPELTYMLSILPHEEINTLSDALKEANGDTTDAISIVMKKNHSVST